jgi:tetrahydromethanopterin S-methyltransferase subunit E
MWGIILKEWKGVSKKTAKTIAAGIITIIVAVIIVGIGNSRHEKMKQQKDLSYVNSNSRI